MSKRNPINSQQNKNKGTGVIVGNWGCCKLFNIFLCFMLFPTFVENNFFGGGLFKIKRSHFMFSSRFSGGGGGGGI